LESTTQLLKSMRSEPTSPAPRAKIWYQTETTVNVKPARLSELWESLAEAKSLVESHPAKTGVVKAHSLLRQPIARFLVSLNDDCPGLNAHPPSIVLNRTQIEIASEDWTKRLLLCEKSVRRAIKDSMSLQSDQSSIPFIVEMLP